MSESYDNISIRRERVGNGASAPADQKKSGEKPPARPSPVRSKPPAKSAPPARASHGVWDKLERQKMKIAAVLLALFAVFILLALISYTPYDEASASLSLQDLGGMLRGDEAVRARADTTHNWLGLLGAVISSFCYNFTIGYASLMYPVLLMLWSKHLYKEQITRKLILITSLSLVFGILFSAFTGTVQRVDWMLDLRPEWSGAIGQFIASVFTQLIGATGSFLLLVAATVVVLIVGVDLDIEKTVFRVRLEVAKLLDRLEARKKQSVKKRSLQDEEEDTLNTAQQTRQSSAADNDDIEEPARVLRRQAEQQGTAVARRDLINRYQEEVQEEPPSEVVPEVERQVAQEPVPAKPVTPVIRRPDFSGSSALTPNAVAPTKAEPAKAEPVVALTHETIQAAEQPLSRTIEPDPLPASVVARTTAKATYEPPPFDIDSENDNVPAKATADMAEEHTRALRLTVQELEEEKKVEAKAFVQSDPLDEELNYHPPTVDFLVEEPEYNEVDDEELKENGITLQEKLKTFKIDIEDLTVTPGPVVTQYEFVPAAGIKVSQIENLADDIALALKARGIRIVAPVPGRGTVAVEIPNTKPKVVRFSSIIRSPKFLDAKHRLPIALGKTINGEVFCDDLAKMPHLLIAGSTGSGKSVGINTIIASLLYKMHPRYLKFMIVDPKKIEMSQYRPLIKHFLAVCPDIDEDIITTPQNAIIGLGSVVTEMERRYDILAKVGQRNIVDYNKKVSEGKYRDTTDFVHREMPYIVVVIDELADLMITAGREVEEPITRLAQLARAVGIHLVVATQRPSVDVITGIIKANFPARIAYQVASKIDSRTILDTNGAEHLLGNGDMLYVPAGAKPIRLQNSFLSTEEVELICEHIGKQKGYSQPYTLPSAKENKNGNRGGGGGNSDDRDDLFDEAAHLIVRHQQGSVSLLQRRLKIGYSRAARIVDQLEEAGIVGPFDGSKARQVLLESEAELEAYL